MRHLNRRMAANDARAMNGPHMTDAGKKPMDCIDSNLGGTEMPKRVFLYSNDDISAVARTVSRPMTSHPTSCRSENHRDD